MKTDIVLNEDDKYELVDPEEKLKKEEEGQSLINDVAKSVYNKPRHDEELNLYGRILSSIVEDKDREDFKEIFDKVEPTLIHRNDIVQKVIISSVLLNKLFLMKHKDPDMDIFKITKGICFREDNGTWLNIMIKYTIPVLVNNDLIKEIKNV